MDKMVYVAYDNHNDCEYVCGVSDDYETVREIINYNKHHNTPAELERRKYYI